MSFHLLSLSPSRVVPHHVPFLKSGGSDDDVESSDEDIDADPSVFDSASLITSQVAIGEDLPDASRANRRPPDYSPALHVATKNHLYGIAIYRNIIIAGHGGKLKTFTISSNLIEEKSIHLSSDKEIKLTALLFKPGPDEVDEVNGRRSPQERGRYLWCGTKDGTIMEFDCVDSSVTISRGNTHTSPVILLERVGDNVIALDESGKIALWIPREKGSGINLTDAPITQRIDLDRYSYSFMVGEQLWVATAADNSTSKTLVPRLRMYQPFHDDRPFNAVSRPCSVPDAFGGDSIGLVTCAAVLPLKSDVVYIGHQGGHISIWNRSTYSCIAVQRVAIDVTSLAGVEDCLWAGDKKGGIKVYNVESIPWRVVKQWNAHDSAVISILVDPYSTIDGKLQVASASLEGEIHLWDGLLASDWLLEELEQREVDFSSYRSMKALIFSYNIDGNSPEHFEDQHFPNMNAVFAQGEPPDLIVIGIQELVNLVDTKIVAKSFIFGGVRRGKGKGAEVGDRVSHQYRLWCGKFTEEIQKHAPVPYRMALTDNLVGLFSIIFIREKEWSNVRNAQASSIKTGFGGRIGNKGAIACSITIDDTSIAFVNCHLAAGHSKTRHRNADLVGILDCAPFESRLSMSDAFAGGGDGSMIMDHRVVILSGDLNYRIDLSRAHCIELIANRNYAGLLAKDQLFREIRHNPAFRLRKFKEAHISFLPTYKYARYTNEWDPSEKQRVPSYCDRIFWYTRQDGIVESNEYRRLEYTPSDHRPISSRMTIKVKREDAGKKSAIIQELQAQWEEQKSKRLDAMRDWYL